jgi:hypothetical protein
MYYGELGYRVNSIHVQKYWVSGLCSLSGIQNTRKHNVSETGSVSVIR